MTKHILYVLTGAAAICAFVAVVSWAPWLLAVGPILFVSYAIGCGIVENIEQRRRK